MSETEQPPCPQQTKNRRCAPASRLDHTPGQNPRNRQLSRPRPATVPADLQRTIKSGTLPPPAARRPPSKHRKVGIPAGQRTLPRGFRAAPRSSGPAEEHRHTPSPPEPGALHPVLARLLDLFLGPSDPVPEHSWFSTRFCRSTAPRSPGRSDRFSFPMTVVPQQHRGIVMERPCDVANQILAQRLQSATGVGLLEQVRPVAERVEGAVRVPRLGDSVGVQQHSPGAKSTR